MLGHDQLSGFCNPARRRNRGCRSPELPVLAWLGGPARARRTLFVCIPLLQIALQYVLAHRAIEGRLTIGLGLHALDARLLLLIAAGMAVGLFD
jgi:hypothetical protein